MSADERSHKQLVALHVAVKTATDAFPLSREEIKGFRSTNEVVFGLWRVPVVAIDTWRPSLEWVRTTKDLCESPNVGVSVFARRDIGTTHGLHVQR